jgi:histidyl-tRNA synthetase
VALIWGEDEVQSESVTVRPLRVDDQGNRGEQQTVPREELTATLQAALAH